MQQSPEFSFPIEAKTRLIEVLEEAGYWGVSVRHDGWRLIVEGDVCSFDDKIHVARLLRPLTEGPILNCVRVHPV